jgi:phosphatidylinositol glycan class N
MVITASSVGHLRAKNGLPLLNQVAGWVVLGIASLFPFTGLGSDPHPRSKILRYFLGFGPAFVILSISVEGLFYSAFSACLVTWVGVEEHIRTAHEATLHQKQLDPLKRGSLKNYHFNPVDTRIAVMFLFFVQIAFFGTGK